MSREGQSGGGTDASATHLLLLCRELQHQGGQVPGTERVRWDMCFFWFWLEERMGDEMLEPRNYQWVSCRVDWSQNKGSGMPAKGTS